jgi:hypothetical protein
LIRTATCAFTMVLLVTGCCLSQTTVPSPSTPVAPILVELFTSEGCSTCPPADRFLEVLDTQPLDGVQLVVLSEHVDYWDHDGWKDRFSSAQFTERQQGYVSHFRLPSAYTPQLVIDGSRQMSGVSVKDADKAFKELQKFPKMDLRIKETVLEGAQVRVRIESNGVAVSKVARSLDLYVALALNHAESQVERGENANRHLTHTAVVLKMARSGKLKVGEAFSHDVQLKIEPGMDTRNLRVVSFLQDPDSRAVFAATMKAVNVPHAR